MDENQQKNLVNAKYRPLILERAAQRGWSEKDLRRELTTRGVATSVLSRFFTHKQDVQSKNLQIMLDCVGIDMMERDGTLNRDRDDILLRRSELKGTDYYWMESLAPAIKAHDDDMVKAIIKQVAKHFEKKDALKEKEAAYPSKGV